MSRLLGEPAQCRLGGLLDVGLFGRCGLELYRERGEAGHEAGARFRRTPPDPVIEVAEAVAYSTASEVFPTPPMPCTAARPTCVTAAGLSLGENGVEPVERVRATRETRNARRDADKSPAPSPLRPLRRRTGAPPRQ